MSANWWTTSLLSALLHPSGKVVELRDSVSGVSTTKLSRGATRFAISSRSEIISGISSSSIVKCDKSANCLTNAASIFRKDSDCRGETSLDECIDIGTTPFLSLTR
eukprot:GHVT01068476.1.p2 GENE.GHVT01068476.1~~GHVT01068476.1.p2  ORF type:complete len:106 (+),score=3.02 GHVT01068476.1:992-1309(+)